MPKFEPGSSGNAGGRPKEDPALRQLARERSQEALAVLISVMNNKKAAPSARITAASSVLDRGYGRPGNSVELTGKGSAPLLKAEEMSDLELARRVAFLLKLGEREASQRADSQDPQMPAESKRL